MPILALLAALSVALSACDTPAQSAPASGQAGPALIQEAESLQGRVVGVADGDTITILVRGREEVRVRLAEIDAPERGQPWGNRSKQLLSEMVFGREVVVHQTDIDRWGRVVGHVSVDGRDVNREMVTLGAAWAYRRYLTDPSLVEVEARSRRDRLGLWSMANGEVVAPWDWRQGQRVARTSSDQTEVPPVRSQGGSSPTGEFSCGSKTRCSQMSSCAEAEFYLRQCRLETIDGNRDGEPCEQLCIAGSSR